MNPIKFTTTSLIAIAIVWVLSGGIKSTMGVDTPEVSTEASYFPPAELATIRTAAPSLDDLLDAIEWVESKGDKDAIGDNGNAVGPYQIWKIFVDDVNRIKKLNTSKYDTFLPYKYEHRTHFGLSRQMASIYLNHYGGTLEEMARKFNGGPQGHKKESTKAYWLKVKARMEAK